MKHVGTGHKSISGDRHGLRYTPNVIRAEGSPTGNCQSGDWGDQTQASQVGSVHPVDPFRFHPVIPMHVNLSLTAHHLVHRSSDSVWPCFCSWQWDVPIVTTARRLTASQTVESGYQTLIARSPLALTPPPSVFYPFPLIRLLGDDYLNPLGASIIKSVATTSTSSQAESSTSAVRRYPEHVTEARSRERGRSVYELICTF